MRNRIIMVAVLATLLLLSQAALASHFCGGNGMVKLSFTAGPELEAAKTVEPGEGGMTTVQVWAVLEDVVPLEGPMGAFLALGGFELELVVEGAEFTITEKKIDIPHRDFGATVAQCRVGSVPGEPIVDGRLVLCHWTVLFTGEVSDVRFSLNPKGIPTCNGDEDCDASGASAIYVGSVDSGQEGEIFGAGQVPAVLNPSGKLKVKAVPFEVGFEEVGRYKPRVSRRQ